MVIIDLNGRLLDKAGQDATIFSHSSKWKNLSFIVVKNLSFEASVAKIEQEIILCSMIQKICHNEENNCMKMQDN